MQNELPSKLVWKIRKRNPAFSGKRESRKIRVLPTERVEMCVEGENTNRK